MRLALILIKLVFLLNCCIGQSSKGSFGHSHPIVKLGLDDHQQLLFLDAQGDHFGLGYKNLVPADKSLVSDDRRPYNIVNGQLRIWSGNTFSIVQADSPVLAYAPFGDQLFVSTESGLHILDNNQLKEYFIADVQFPTQITKLISTAQLLGLLSADGGLYIYKVAQQDLQLIDTEVNDFTIDKWSCIWYATQDFLHYNADYDPGTVGPELYNLKVIDDRDQERSKPHLVFDSEDNYCTIHFDVVYPPTLNEVKVAYRLSRQADWMPAPSSRMIPLRNLPMGQHRLELSLQDAKANVTVFDNLLDIKVQSRTWWYWPAVLGSLATLLLVAFGFQRKHNTELTALEKEKEKIRLQLAVQNEQQKIGQLQLNPHFLFNSLNSINGLIAMNENKKARKYLSQFSIMMRKLLEGSRHENILIKEEIKFLETYISLEQMCRNDKFDYKLESDLDDEVVIPAMMIQPFVENAIVHGLSPKTTQGQLLIKLENEAKYVKVIIEDDGIGRAAAANNRTESHESAAMSILEQRLSVLDRWGQKGFSYEDLINEKGEAIGTRVNLYLPKQA